jgi:hypothetical protein
MTANTSVKGSAGAELAVTIFVILGQISFLFFGVLGLVHPETILSVIGHPGTINKVAHNFINIFVARNLPLGLFPLLLLAMKERRALGFSLFLMGAIQALDFGYSVTGHALTPIVASIVLTVLYFVSGWYLLTRKAPNKTA